MKPMIAKFSALEAPDVAEHLDVTWDEWLDYLAKAPTRDFAGKMEHGGWSPVLFDPPARAKANVKWVFALVLDYDKDGSWERIHEAWCHSYGLLYTTKSHGAPNTIGDRLRLVLPLDRPVTSDEYTRIWDWAARMSQEIGCPVDKQTKDASRFWYTPSTPPGGWRSIKLDGKAINPDAILALGEPTPPKLRVVRPARTPDASERERRARAYLAKMPGGVQGSYGSTAMFNAVSVLLIGFDLGEALTLRLIQEDYNQRCDPPFSDHEIEHKIASCRKTSTRSAGYLLVDRPRIESTHQAASYAPPAPAELDVDWQTQLLTKKDFTPRRTYHNTLIFVRHFPDYRGKWTLDEMTGMPWFDGEPLRPTLVHDIRAHIERRLGYTSSPQDVEAAIATSARDRPFHPIRQYLRSLDWDGKPRLSSMAVEYLGATEPHHAVMVRKFMIGAAARALWPGCKQDTALMLVGAQGIGKSTFFSVLGGNWHADSFVDITNKDSFVQIHSAWIYELAELENVVHGRAESRLKAWLTSTHDMFRAPYQRTAERRARAVVICGTTNRSQFITDETGSRRFHIVPVNQMIDRDLLAHARDQLWAEALCAAESGEQWWLDADAETAREIANVEHEEEDVWLEPVMRWLDRPTCKETSSAEVLTDALKIDAARQDRAAQMRVAKVLAKIGWRRSRTNTTPRRWMYVRGEA